MPVLVMFSMSIIDDSWSIIDDSWSIIDDSMSIIDDSRSINDTSRVIRIILASNTPSCGIILTTTEVSFTIVIFYIFIIQATGLNSI
jgi:hypothetical protein